MNNNRSRHNNKKKIENSKNYLHFKSELEHYDTQYFILDTHGDKDKYKDSDFVEYSWSTRRYNKVKEGDLFVYRRPQKSSEIKGQFYFFGAGKIGKIAESTEGNVTTKIEKPLTFSEYILKSDLEEVEWDFKDRTRKDWQHFFNQYGMNKISKKDFLMLIKKV
ncbi:hypothetical protein [Alkalibacterium kapii]|uniref:EVE domain-containing protein n=1 Tax=Alkalibacterium kapii TaxID=426704 RepID=A0A511AUF7_9LACT|nr:hypothetical protein [Alkalibacterium kapii]GEK91835.1 hypothetical protein AKA01nite_14570 [Alkalibacterium kapii]